MDNTFALPSRPGVKTNCEEEIMELLLEIQRYKQRNDIELHTLRMHNKELEIEINEKKYQISGLTQQCTFLENSCHIQVTELRNQIAQLDKNYGDQTLTHRATLNQRNKEQKELQNKNDSLEKEVLEMKNLLNSVRKTEEKLVNTVKDLNQKLDIKEDQLNQIRRNENKQKRIPTDSEIEVWAKNISNCFLEEETHYYERLQKDISNKIHDLEMKINLC